MLLSKLPLQHLRNSNIFLIISYFSQEVLILQYLNMLPEITTQIQRKKENEVFNQI